MVAAAAATAAAAAAARSLTQIPQGGTRWNNLEILYFTMDLVCPPKYHRDELKNLKILNYNGFGVNTKQIRKNGWESNL